MKDAKVEKGWYSAGDQKFPRMWLSLESGNLLVSWDEIRKIMATSDFLSITFECEVGVIKINATESLQGLFEDFQLESVRKINGRILKIELIQIEQ